ncbi:MAG: ZIP family metal transporter [Steroidobacteraceae bacterium]
MPLLGWIILFTAVGGIASAAFAGLFLLLPENTGLRMLPHFVSFATGALIGAALLGLLPEAMESVGPAGAHGIGAALVVGLGVFFIIEKLVLWRHAHSHEREDLAEREVAAGSGHADGEPFGESASAGTLAADGGAEGRALRAIIAEPAAQNVVFVAGAGGHAAVRSAALAPLHPTSSRTEGGHGHEHGHSHVRSQERSSDQRQHDHSHAGHGHDHSRDGAAGVLVLIGDSIHNALDGILIAAAFLTNVPLGLVTTVAVAAHEIPHRVGDFALLLHAGMSRRRAMFLNMATGLASVLGGIVAYFGLSKAQGALPYALALAAAGFLYIAVAGLIPGLHRRADPRTSLAQVLLMGLGVGVIAWAESLTH